MAAKNKGCLASVGTIALLCFGSCLFFGLLGQFIRKDDGGNNGAPVVARPPAASVQAPESGLIAVERVKHQPKALN